MPSDYYCMSKAFFTGKHHPKLVILSVSPRSFLDATLASASATETFQFLSPYVDLGNLANYSFANPVEKFLWLIKKQLALFRYRQDFNLIVYTLMEDLLNSLNGKNQNSDESKTLSSEQFFSGNFMVMMDL